MEAIAIPMPLWWRLLGRLYAFALRLIPQEKQQTKADDRAGQMAADALDTYGNAILRCAYSYLHNMADAEEVLQDTLLKLLTAAPNFESEEHKKAWLLRVAANLSKNRIEYNALRTSDELSDELAEEGREDLSFVWDAVKELPVQFREVIHLHYYEGYSTEEIAKILQRNPSTVRSDLRRGREKLKIILQEGYEQIMDKIEVTPEMRQRVLRNVEAEQAKQKKRQLTRRLVTLAACLAIVVCCWYVWKPKQTDPPEQGMMAVARIDTVDSLEALTEKTGIPMNELTGVPFTVERTEYVSYWDELAEIQYFGGNDSLCYRKSPGTEDNSGDYNVYAQEETLEISGNAVTLKGGNGAYSLAILTDGSYAYSISVTNPLSEDAFRTLLEENF